MMEINDEKDTKFLHTIDEKDTVKLGISEEKKRRSFLPVKRKVMKSLTPLKKKELASLVSMSRKILGTKKDKIDNFIEKGPKVIETTEEKGSIGNTEKKEDGFKTYKIFRFIGSTDKKLSEENSIEMLNTYYDENNLDMLDAHEESNIEDFDFYQ